MEQAMVAMVHQQHRQEACKAVAFREAAAARAAADAQAKTVTGAACVRAA
jgi:hypothetical protein